MNFDRIRRKSELRIVQLHALSKKIWSKLNLTPLDLQNKCLDAWDDINNEMGCKISPLISVTDATKITNVIFGSGSFTTGEYQVKQYKEVQYYLKNPPVSLTGIVSNKRMEHGSNARNLCEKYKIPLIEFDFIDWYEEFIDGTEINPVRASRYWFGKNEPNQPSKEEIKERFDIRQNIYHNLLGEKIQEVVSEPINIASARGYNFQFCSNMFKQAKIPHINDTHPADLTYVDHHNNYSKKYAGWSSGAIKLMQNDKQKLIRGSLISVEPMDIIEQIHELDEGILLSLGKGISIPKNLNLDASFIQSLLKIMDDNFFCTLEPTGLLLLFGVTDKKFPVQYRKSNGELVEVMEKLVIVGDKIHSGINAWGARLNKDIKELEQFLSL